MRCSALLRKNADHHKAVVSVRDDGGYHFDLQQTEETLTLGGQNERNDSLVHNVVDILRSHINPGPLIDR